MPNNITQSALILSVLILSVVVLSVVILSVVTECHCSKSHFACYYAEFHNAKWHYLEFHYSYCHYSKFPFASVMAPSTNFTIILFFRSLNYNRYTIRNAVSGGNTSLEHEIVDCFISFTFISAKNDPIKEN